MRTCRYDYSRELGEDRSGPEDNRFTCGLPAEHHIVAFGLDPCQGEQLVAQTATFGCDTHIRMVRSVWHERGVVWLDHPLGEYCLGQVFAVDTLLNTCVPVPDLH
jgi:hypothetical protein